MAGDCLDLPFADESFDLITIAFGLRNLADRAKGLSEMRRVLRPGGRLIVLEFCSALPLVSSLLLFVFRGVLPWVARWMTGDRDAYLYLGSSISEFPDRAGLVQEIEQSGFSHVQCPCPYLFHCCIARREKRVKKKG